MKYILLNQDNIVVDILDEIRYIKLQSSNGITVACEEKEGTGVIGSDCNTHYTLSRANLDSSPNAVSIMEMEEIPSNIVVNKTHYNHETQEFEAYYPPEEDITSMLVDQEYRLTLLELGITEEE